VRVDFPREPASLLHRLGVGEPLAGYWARARIRFSITPRYGNLLVTSARLYLTSVLA